MTIIAPAMSAQRLPQSVPVDRFCGGGRRASATLVAAQLPRLSAELGEGDWSLAVSLVGESLGVARYRVSGTVEGVLPLQCVRCMGSVAWPLALELSVMVVEGDDEEARWIGKYDTWRAEDNRLALCERIEDEVLLALPDLPRCAQDSCLATARGNSRNGTEPGADGE